MTTKLSKQIIPYDHNGRFVKAEVLKKYWMEKYNIVAFLNADEWAKRNPAGYWRISLLWMISFV